MMARNMLPDLLNEIAAKQGRPGTYPEHGEIHLKLERVWEQIPRLGDSILVHDDAEPKRVENVWWRLDGLVDVFVEDLDTDEVADNEGLVIEELLNAEWEIDWDMMPRF